jgi:hypothetical protein
MTVTLAETIAENDRCVRNVTCATVYPSTQPHENAHETGGFDAL